MNVIIIGIGIVLSELIFSVAHAEDTDSPPSAECIAPLIQDVNISAQNGIVQPVKKIIMEFKVDERNNGSETVWLIIPSVKIISDFQQRLDEAKSDIISAISQKISGSITLSGFSFSSPAITGRNLDLPADFSVKKDASMTGFCCSGIECKSCLWTTTLWERKVKYNVTFNHSIIAAQNTISSGEMGTSTMAAETAASLSLKATGHINNDLNTPEGVWDIVAGLYEAIASIFNGHDQIQFSDYLGMNFTGGSYSLGAQQLFSDNLERHAYSQELLRAKLLRSYDAGTDWQLFNSAMVLNGTDSAFIAVNPVMHVTQYTLNISQYLKSLGTKSLTANLLDWRIFCDRTRASLQNDYLPSLARKIAGDDKKSNMIQPTSYRGLKESLAQAYGAGGTEEFYRRQVKLHGLGAQAKIFSLVPKELLKNIRGVIPAGGSLWTTAREQSWSRKEATCSYTLALKRTGTVNKVYPLQDFRTCMDSEERGYAQDIWDLVDRKLGTRDYNAVTQLVSPVAGATSYRGWYYCSRNPSVCSGDNRVMWATELSRFGARGNIHKGVDLMSPSKGENINLEAVANGQLIYHNTNPHGWGNALLLPFSYNSKRYIAVYAHLPETAKKLDGVKVIAAQNIGSAGCTGNAGNGLGKCNNYCSVGAFKASDIHLHFELLKDENGLKIGVDPQSVINFAIGTEGDKKLYTCQ